MKTAILINSLFILSILGTTVISAPQSRVEKATFAGGCFWCMAPPFEDLDGVLGVVSGYTGGKKVNPTYKDVTSGATGHVEAIEVTYDPAKISYQQLLDVFWRQINPMDDAGQFVDRGSSYQSAVFYHTEDQKKLAEESKQKLDRSGRFDRPIVTQVRAAGPFYRAEDYHQNYDKKNPQRYKFYRYNSGRDSYLEQFWGKATPKGGKPAWEGNSFVKPGSDELQGRLSPIQFQVTQNNGTEPAFRNLYWDNKQPGIYVDIVSGEPLFSSLDKYDSGTGWPSFTKPLEPGNIVEKKDRSWSLSVRTEVRSKHANSHLGHVFNDGPLPTGLRYCMNSAALRFIPFEDLEREGYAKYAGLFKPDTSNAKNRK